MRVFLQNIFYTSHYKVMSIISFKTADSHKDLFQSDDNQKITYFIPEIHCYRQQ